eukprot:m51a1_g7643 hypothetical protein (142) ;mRNA; f:370214-370639
MAVPPKQTRSLTERRQFDEGEKRWAFAREGGRCRYCQRQLGYELYGERKKGTGGHCYWEVDHIKPFSAESHANGGPNHYLNLSAACWQCNREKSSYTPREWAAVSESPLLCQATTKHDRSCRRLVKKGNRKYCEKHSRTSK